MANRFFFPAFTALCGGLETKSTTKEKAIFVLSSQPWAVLGRGRTLSSKVRKRAQRWDEAASGAQRRSCSTLGFAARGARSSSQKRDGSRARCSLRLRSLGCLRAVLPRCYSTDVRSGGLFIPPASEDSHRTQPESWPPATGGMFNSL